MHFILGIPVLLGVACLAGCGLPGDQGGVAGQPLLESGPASSPGFGGYLYGLHEYHWASSEKREQLALRLPLYFSQPTPCVISVAGVAHLEGKRQLYVQIEEINGELSLLRTFSSGQIITAYSGSLEARGLPYGEESGDNSYKIVLPGEFTGNFTLTHLTQGVTPRDGGFAPGKGIALSVSCEGTFDIVGASQGDEATLLEIRNLSGNGVIIEGLASATLDATASTNVAGTQAGFYMGAGSFHQDETSAGEAELRYPDGLQTWTFGPDGLHATHLTSGPGSYDLSMTRVAGPLGFWFAGAYSLSRAFDLLAGRLDQSAIVSGGGG